MRFSEANAVYLDEKKHQNAAQTIVEKGRTYKDFTDLFYVVGEENDNVLMTAVMREFSKLRDELNAAISFSHLSKVFNSARMARD